MSTMEHPEKYRSPGSRNFVRVGDVVACRPAHGARFLAVVTRIDVDEKGTVQAVNVAVRSKVNGADHPHRGWSRAFTPDRITRKVRIPEARS